MSKVLTAALYAVAASSSTASSSSESKKESTTSGKSALKTLNLNQASTLADVELTSTCSPPTKLGGVGYCGPDFCGASFDVCLLLHCCFLIFSSFTSFL